MVDAADRACIGCDGCVGRVEFHGCRTIHLHAVLGWLRSLGKFATTRINDGSIRFQQQSQSGGGGGGGDQPLLKKSAELKLLEKAQKRINRRTDQIERIRGPGGVGDAIKAELDNLARQQKKIVEMTEQIMDKE